MCSVQVVKLKLFCHFSKGKQKEFHPFLQNVLNFGIHEETMNLFCILLAEICLYSISGIHKCRQQWSVNSSWKDTITLAVDLHSIQMTTTTDYRRPGRKSPSLNGRKSTPTPKFLGTPKHILSATSAHFFRYIWLMTSLGVRSPYCQPCTPAHDAVRVGCSNVMAPLPQETVAPTAASTAAVVVGGWMR